MQTQHPEKSFIFQHDGALQYQFLKTRDVIVTSSVALQRHPSSAMVPLEGEIAVY